MKKNILETVLLTILFSMPCIYRVMLNGSDTYFYLFLCILAILPLTFLLQSIRNTRIFAFFLTLLLVSPYVETFLIVVYKDFIRTGNLLSVATTTKRESSNFFANNFPILLYEIPVVLTYLGAIKLHKRFSTPWRYGLIAAMLSLMVSLIFNTFAGISATHNPPYNFFVEVGHAYWQRHQRERLLPEGEDFSFGAVRQESEQTENGEPLREIYIFGVGESLRYDHTGFSGYERNTTPLLSSNPQVISFSNYYSNATLTFYSVPMMLSRATADDYNQHYRERSIVVPFRECGFQTFVISCKKLLANEPYITRGNHGIIAVSSDADIPRVVDSLANIYPKLFCVVQMLQCHSYYNNFTSSFDRFHPNLVDEPEGASKDTLYTNAYDNCVLYTDYILSQLTDTINRPGTQSALLFASDHGEILKTNGSRRGNSLTPGKEEYHVPFLFWANDIWRRNLKEQADLAEAHKDMPLCADNLFYSALDMAGISIRKDLADSTYSIFSESLKPHDRRLLLPDGRSILRQDKRKK